MKDTWKFYKDEAGRYRWQRKAANGEITGAASQGYARKHTCVMNAARNGYLKSGRIKWV